MNARTPMALVAVLVCVLAAACSNGNAPENAAASSSAAPGLRLVSLGDSDATGAGDEEGTGWVQRYADLVGKQTGSDVAVVSHAQEGLTSHALLARLRSDADLQEDVRAADLVVIGAGGADLNAGDEAGTPGSAPVPPATSRCSTPTPRTSTRSRRRSRSCATGSRPSSGR